MVTKWKHDYSDKFLEDYYINSKDYEYLEMTYYVSKITGTQTAAYVKSLYPDLKEKYDGMRRCKYSKTKASSIYYDIYENKLPLEEISKKYNIPLGSVLNVGSYISKLYPELGNDRHIKFKRWSYDVIKELFKDYYSRMSSEELINKYGIEVKALRIIINNSRSKYPDLDKKYRNARRVKWDRDLTDNFLKDYYDNIPRREMCEKYDIKDPRTISRLYVYLLNRYPKVTKKYVNKKRGGSKS